MIDLLFWFLMSQTLAGLPEMAPGTAVWLMSDDLLTKYASAEVRDGELRFEQPLEPNQPLRVFVFPPGMSDQERALVASGATALVGRVSSDGIDILLQFPELEGPLSLRKWLTDERDVALVLPEAP